MRGAPFCALMVAGSLLTSACATAPTSGAVLAPASAPAVSLSDQVQRGSYRALERAFAAAVQSNASDDAFEIAVLLAVRAKELGLPPGPWLDRALDRLPGTSWEVHLEVARAVGVDPLTDDAAEVASFRRRQRRTADEVATFRDRVASGPGSTLLRTYLDLTLACALPDDEREQAVAAATAAFEDVPLVQYRAALCRPEDPSPLARLQDADVEFSDVDVPLARAALLTHPYPNYEQALARLRAARKAFPASPLVTMLLGRLHQSWEEWPQALDAFEATTRLVPAHREALLGRTIALSNLNRHEEAISEATTILELGDWNNGPAYYWRGWNAYYLGDMAAARADTDRARSLMRNAAVYVLSGMIEWKEGRLDTGESELTEAISMDAGQCEAAAVLGGIRSETQRWEEALAAFQQAQRCFDLTVALRREMIVQLQTAPANAGSAQLIVNHRRVLDDAQRNSDDAAANAARIQAVMGSQGE